MILQQTHYPIKGIAWGNVLLITIAVGIAVLYLRHEFVVNAPLSLKKEGIENQP